MSIKPNRTQLIADRYGFSPRLKASMCCDPLKPDAVATHNTGQSRAHPVFHPRTARRDRKQAAAGFQQQSLKDDPETYEMEQETTVSEGLLDLNHYRIANDVWHFMSVDWGYQCMPAPNRDSIVLTERRYLHWVQLIVPCESKFCRLDQ